MNWIKLAEFVNVVLPQIALAHKPVLEALFVTYNTVGGFEDGIVPGTPEGLTVKVHAGGAFPSLSGAIILAHAHSVGDHKLADATIDSMRADAAGYQHEVCAEVQKDLPLATGGENVLVVAYAGLSAFESAIECVREYREKLPKCEVAVLACDCDHREKARQLSALVAEKVVTYPVLTSNCGGRSDMGAIARTLMAAW